jgi:hypothetical protein
VGRIMAKSLRQNIEKQLSYGEYMKKSLKLDKLEQEELNLRTLINNLVESDGVNAAHQHTGLVYNKLVLNNRLNNIIAEIKELIVELENNK